MSRLPPADPVSVAPKPPAPETDPFPTTCWGMLGRCAGGGDDPQVAAALATLFWRYRPAVLAYVRRHTPCEADAEDLTQGFFADFFGRGLPGRADPARGRFRALLSTCLRRYLHGEAERRGARKRGGGLVLVSWEETGAGKETAAADPSPPHLRRRAEEARFDRHWAATLLDGVRDRLERECRQAHGAEGVKQLLPWLVGGEGDGDRDAHERAAAALGWSLAAYRGVLHRLRARHKTLLRAAVAQTVAEPGEIDAELRHLVAAWIATGQ